MRPAYIFGENETSYRFHADHPFNPIRLELTTSLLTTAGKLSRDECIAPPLASIEDLALVHDRDYIEAVQAAAAGTLTGLKANKFGLGTEDTPIFPTIHEGAARLVGGTMLALDLVASGKVERAFHVGGGLHHGMQRKASGFCVYNDAAVAIAHVRKQYGMRVLYVDTDAHHGDGVQWLFYDDPDVMTLSIHETGRYLFLAQVPSPSVGTGTDTATVGTSRSTPSRRTTRSFIVMRRCYARRALGSSRTSF